MLSLKRSPALAVLLCVLHVPPTASADDLSDIRNQLRALSERVSRLEQENAALKDKNQSLQAEQAKSSAPAVDGAKASWTDRVKLSADVRYRHEQTSDDSLDASGVRTADRERDRIRARISARLQATDTVELGIGLASGEGGDPRSTNQTLGDVFSRKSLDLDLAYLDWRFATWGHAIAGKMRQPFFRPGQSLFWDSDITPEGVALTFERGVVFGSAYRFWLDEVSGPENARTSDTMLYGGQVGARLPLRESSLILAAHYYDLSAERGRAPFYNGNPNGNTTIDVGVPPSSVLLHDYRVIDLMAELNTHWETPWGRIPLQFWTDLARNQDPDDRNTAWSAGASLGEAADAGTWGIGFDYHDVEKDAIFGQFIDGDLGGGQTDVAGWVLRAAYAPVKNVTLNATYFINERNVDVPNAANQTDVDFRRLQLDLNTKF